MEGWGHSYEEASVIRSKYACPFIDVPRPPSSIAPRAYACARACTNAHTGVGFGVEPRMI